MQDPGNDWKTAILADFAQWLRDLPSAPADPSPSPEKRRGLADLYSEVAALRQELVLQNRTQHKSVAGLDAARAAFSELGAQLRGQTAAQNGGPARPDDGTEALSIITSFLEIRDSLERMRSLARGLASPDGDATRPDADPVSLVQTLELVLRKFDRTLEDHGVSRIDTVGMPFDPSTMSAAGTCNDPEIRNGIVVEEIRGGFLVGERVMRAAEVFVNMCSQTVGDRDE